MLNTSQKVAVCHKDGPAIVLAGPGSGKTTIITHRIKNLIEKCDVSPEKIMVVTFTKAAAENMEKRFRCMMEEAKGTSPVLFGTFHSIYYRILQQDCSYNRESIIDEREKFKLLKEIAVYKKADVYSLDNFVRIISEEISAIKGNMTDVGEYLPKACEPKMFYEIYEEYKKVLKQEGKLDFDDILIHCYELLKCDDDICRKWQKSFAHILVDEFQDINRIQYEIIRILAAPCNNLFVVGDDDQSIYGFRGACPQMMFQFKKDYPKAREIYLTINYRSVAEICGIADNLIRNNKMRFQKNIIAEKEKSKSIPYEIKSFKNQNMQFNYIADKIETYLKQDLKKTDIAVLVRNNYQIEHLRSHLQNRGIGVPSTREDGRLYESMVAKDIVAYIKAAITVENMPLGNNENLIYILNKPSRYIGRNVLAMPEMTFEKMGKFYAHSREVWKNIEKLRFDLEMISKLKPLAACLYIRNGVGYEKYLVRYAMEKNIKIKPLLEMLEKLQLDAATYRTIPEWLDSIERKRHRAQNEKNPLGIQIMTMHRAKGLEFPVVFIPDANQGIIPSSATIRSEDFEEERRLFYVAMTRAIEHLHIYYVEECLGCQANPSMFVGECLNKKEIVNKSRTFH